MRGETFEGKNIVRGQTQNSFSRQRSRKLAGTEDGRMKTFCGLVVRDDNDARSICRTNERREIKGACSGGQAGDTATPSPGTKMALDTFKSD